MSFAHPETLGDFLDRLAAGDFPGDVPQSFHHLRKKVELRFAAGEEEFGDAYRRRDNLLEAEEEDCDGIVYRYLAVLRRFEETGDHEGIQLALEACKHTYEAWLCDRQLEGKWRGDP